MKKPIVILTGPTAVGKTKASLGLAKKIGGEIISADSMQVYKYMDIGSAKILPDQMEGIPHYLVDEIMPWEEFNVFRFQEMAKNALDKIYTNGHIPIVVGGTGFYIQALLYDIDFKDNASDDGYREFLEEIAEREGAMKLHEMLFLIDPDSADQIHANNVKRTIRAIEYYHQTGQRMSEHNRIEREKKSPYLFWYFVLNDERNRLYERIDQRVDEMIEEGLLGEVKKLASMGCTKDMVSMQGLGYKEVLSFLDGEITLDEAIYQIKRDTRHFAKRQITWFKREKDVYWIDKRDFDYDEERIIEYMTQIIENRLQEGDEF